MAVLSWASRIKGATPRIERQSAKVCFMAFLLQRERYRRIRGLLALLRDKANLPIARRQSRRGRGGDILNPALRVRLSELRRGSLPKHLPILAEDHHHARLLGILFVRINGQVKRKSVIIGLLQNW